jgi:hypothetical protein
LKTVRVAVVVANIWGMMSGICKNVAHVKIKGKTNMYINSIQIESTVKANENEEQLIAAFFKTNTARYLPFTKQDYIQFLEFCYKIEREDV